MKRRKKIVTPTSQPENNEESTMTTPPSKAASAPQYTYVDLPDVPETFADSLQIVTFDGQSLRLTFNVTRLDQKSTAGTPSSIRYPACRLVLTPSAGIELINQMQRIAAALVQSGVFKQQTPKASPEKDN